MKTVTLAGKVFPVAALICPLGDENPDEDEFDRSLGSGGADRTLWIPTENGLLFELVPPDERRGWDLWLCCPACYKSYDLENEWLWLPQGVQLVDGDLLPQSRKDGRGGSFWINCEPDWMAETIYRLAHKPFSMPEGPQVKLVDGDYFAKEAAEALRNRTDA